jgi:hypothetical protein
MITAYQFAKTVNTLLAAADIEKVLPPQMFYTYYKKGFIKAEAQTQAGAVEWAAKYVRKHYPEVFVEEHRENLTEETIVKVASERVEILSIEA